MEFDDLKRPKDGLVVCLREMGNGKSRIFFDEVLSNKDENPKTWEYDAFYTFTPELEDGDLNAMNLTESQFADIGVTVVARLLAARGRVK